MASDKNGGFPPTLIKNPEVWCAPRVQMEGLRDPRPGRELCVVVSSLFPPGSTGKLETMLGL